MTKLSETQTAVLTASAQRPGGIALPLPNRLAGAAAKMAVTRMITLGWLQEVEANVRRADPLGSGEEGQVLVGQSLEVPQRLAATEAQGRAEPSASAIRVRAATGVRTRRQRSSTEAKGWSARPSTIAAAWALARPLTCAARAGPQSAGRRREAPRCSPNARH